jgi:hypothetical protein
MLIPVKPSPKEEAVFAELSASWLNPDVKAPSDDRLFSYTLLKAALSSPAALSESIESRLTRRRIAALKDLWKPDLDPEVDALRRLWSLAQDATINQPAKLRRLIQVLRVDSIIIT